jgi:hypothetical protein
MAATAPQLEIPEARRAGVERYVAVVRRVVGDAALGLAAFGPGLAGERARHPLDSVLLIARDDLELLRRLGREGGALARDLVAPPVILTPEALSRSRDTFPLELIEIAETRVPLSGDDRFGDLEFAREHVRLQCERELKSVGVGMRQRVLRAGGDVAALRPHELADAAVRVLRGLLHLQQAPPQRHAPEVITVAQQTLGRPLPAIRAAWSGEAGWEAYAALYAEVEALGALVDGW